MRAVDDSTELWRPIVPWSVRAARRCLLFVVGRVSLDSQVSSDYRRVVISALCHAFFDSKSGSCNDWQDRARELEQELRSPQSNAALDELRRTDSFGSHLLSIEPAQHAKLAKLPTCIAFRLDEGIIDLTDAGAHLAVKVINVSRDGNAVQGKIEFSLSSMSLRFTPAVAFERQCRYKVLVRQHELVTSLGGELPKIDELWTFHFSTPA